MTIRNGDSDREERFKSMYQKYYRRIIRFYVRSFHLSEEDAEELAQDAFVRFYEALAKYRGDAEWGYLKTIAHHIAYNRIRNSLTKKRQAPTVEIDDPNFRDGPATPATQETLLLRKQLREHIAALPAGQRQCIYLRLDGFEYKEIADALRITMDAVKSRIRDAKRLLGVRLGGKLLEGDE